MLSVTYGESVKLPGWFWPCRIWRRYSRCFKSHMWYDFGVGNGQHRYVFRASVRSAQQNAPPE